MESPSEREEISIKKEPSLRPVRKIEERIVRGEVEDEVSFGVGEDAPRRDTLMGRFLVAICAHV